MRSVFVACLANALLVGVVSAESIDGDYLEVRNAAMWAGPCLVNSEIGLAGNKATMAWKVSKGTYKDVRLDGLAVVAVVFGDRTFGIGDQVTTQTVFVVDKRADKSQQAALVEMATALAGETIQKVVAVRRADIKLEIGQGDESGYSVLDAGIAKVRTRRMRPSDNTCGTKERRAYPVLSKVKDERSAFTLENKYSGSAFDVQYTRRHVRSAVLAKFSL